MHAESKRGGETGNLLMDFGFTTEALNNNIGLLAVDPAGLDARVLSHRHYDHFGGIVGFLQQNRGKLKAKLPLYIGGEECFCSRQWVGPPAPGNFGALDRQALEEADLTVTYAAGPSLVGKHAFTTGQIALRSFEKVLSPSTMKIGVEDGIVPKIVSDIVVMGHLPRAQPRQCSAWPRPRHRRVVRQAHRHLNDGRLPFGSWVRCASHRNSQAYRAVRDVASNHLAENPLHLIE